MAQRVTTTITDDIDGTKNAETVTFGLDGAQYEIDLAKRNASALRKAMGEFVSAARTISSSGAQAEKPTRRRSAKGAGKSAGAAKVDVKTIREWAAANGISTSTRGRIAASVVEQYQQSQAAE